MFRENVFVGEYDAGSFAGVVLINAVTLLLSRAESLAGDGVGNAGNDAGSTWCRRYMQCEAIAR